MQQFYRTEITGICIVFTNVDDDNSFCANSKLATTFQQSSFVWGVPSSSLCDQFRRQCFCCRHNIGVFMAHFLNFSNFGGTLSSPAPLPVSIECHSPCWLPLSLSHYPYKLIKTFQPLMSSETRNLKDAMCSGGDGGREGGGKGGGGG